MRLWIIGVLAVTSLTSGCAQMKVIEATDQGRAPELLIASDLVNALMQVDDFHPSNTRLQMQKPKHRFGRYLHKVLIAAGYEIQDVKTRLGNQFVDYWHSDSVTSKDDPAQTYRLSVGQIDIKRDYVSEMGKVRPNSDLFVSGVDASLIKLNDHIFGIPTPGDSLENPRTPDEFPANEPSLELLVNGDLNPRVYSEGDRLVFSIKTAVDAQLACYYKDPDQNLIRIYPNRFVKNSMIRAGEIVHIPSTSDWSIEATRAGSIDEVMCLSYPPSLTSARSQFESTPDLEPLATNSFEELLGDLASATGTVPTAKQLSIRVD